MTPPTTIIRQVGFMLLAQWCKATGISRTAAWRMRQAGDLKTFQRGKRVYVSADASDAFFAAGKKS